MRIVSGDPAADRSDIEVDKVPVGIETDASGNEQK
jgi:hypothetical protein